MQPLAERTGRPARWRGGGRATSIGRRGRGLQCEVTPTASGAQKRLVFGGDITVVADSWRRRRRIPGRAISGRRRRWPCGSSGGKRHTTVVELGCGACPAGPRGRRHGRYRDALDARGPAARAPEARRRRRVCTTSLAAARSTAWTRPPAAGAAGAGDLVLGADRVPGRGRRGARGVYPGNCLPGGTAALCSDEKRAPRLCGSGCESGFVVTRAHATVTPDEAATTTRARRAGGGIFLLLWGRVSSLLCFAVVGPLGGEKQDG